MMLPRSFQIVALAQRFDLDWRRARRQSRGCASRGGDLLGASQFGLDLFDCREGAFELLR
jgi:hypothetical protein